MDYDSPTRGGGRGGLRGNREDGGEFNFRGNSDGFEFEFSFRFNRVGVPSSTRGGFRGGRGGVSKFNGQKRKFDEEGEEKNENEPINKKEKAALVDKKGKIEESDEDEEMDEEDDYEDEEEEEVPVPTKEIVKKEETKSNKKINISNPSTPTTVAKKAPITPHSKGEDAVKTVKLNFDEERDEEEEGGEDEDEDEEKEEAAPLAKLKLAASADVISDQVKKREDDDRKTLYLKGFDKSFDEDKIKALHPLIIDVDRPWGNGKGYFAFAKFVSEANANKAYYDLSKVKGLTVGRTVRQTVVPTRLRVRPIDGATTVAQLKTIFNTASDVKIPRRTSERYALIHFESEEEALSVFNANQSLEINGTPATVLFAFDRATAEKKEAPKQTAAAAKKVVEASDDEEESNDDEEISSSDVKIEEEDEEEPPKKKADLTKPTPAKKIKKDPKKEEYHE